MSCRAGEASAVTSRSIFVMSALFVLAIALLLAAKANANSQVTVDLFQYRPQAGTVTVDGPFEIRTPIVRAMPSGSYSFVSEHGHIECKSKVCELVGSRFALSGTGKQGLKIQYSKGPARRYLGEIIISRGNNGKLKLENILPLDDYVACVVGSETRTGWPREALKAQAVLTQTRMARYKAGDKLLDSTQQEAYLGSEFARPEVLDAVESVVGQILAYNGSPITPWYCAACSGGTSSAVDIFGKGHGDLSYASGVKCNLCKDSPFWKTRCTHIPQQALYNALSISVGAAREPPAHDQWPVVMSEDIRNRPLSIKLPNGKKMSGYQFWLLLGQKLGWDKVPGTRYKLVTAKEDGVEIDSTGAGHGVGMCQWGAAELARQGKSYREILKYYFPKCRVEAEERGLPSPQ